MAAVKTLPFVLLSLLGAHTVSAACVNRFVARTDYPRQVVTLLTGKLTFQEAQALADAIQKRKAPGLEWVTEQGKLVAKQFGDLKVVRPMPVGCDGKPSGVVLVATFGAAVPPQKKMFVRLDPNTVVAFEQQSE